MYACCCPRKNKRERAAISASAVAAATTISESKATITTVTFTSNEPSKLSIAAVSGGETALPIIQKPKMHSHLKIVLFMGSSRQGRNCLRVTRLVQKIVESHGATVIILDPEVLNLEIIGQPLHFRPDPSSAPEVLLRTNEIIKNADGYILVSPEYNRCPGPALLNVTNHFPPASYANKPSAIITYSMGPQGGPMAAAQLRAHVGELGSPSIGRMVMIALVNTVIDESGVSKDEKLTSQLDKQVEQLLWYATAIKLYKAEVPVPL